MRFAQTFAQVVGVMMRDPNFRHAKLTDLESLVLPPLMSGQWRLGQGVLPMPGAKSNGKDGAKPDAPKDAGLVVPVAVALWASVSPEIDARLTSTLQGPLPLKANEWASGKQIWLTAVAGDPRYLPAFLVQLQEKEFKGRSVKVRGQQAGGQPAVLTLDELAAAWRRQAEAAKSGRDPDASK
jgi:hemolysin-activating ACP:hemolysin acyltransferase